MIKIYNTSYNKEKINFSIDVIKKGEIYLDTWSKDYLLINKDKKLVGYNFSGINSYYKIEYLKDENIKGFSYDTTNSSNNNVKFLYTEFDKQDAWLERIILKYKTKRIINYK
jgi:hypothetical protein